MVCVHVGVVANEGVSSADSAPGGSQWSVACSSNLPPSWKEFRQIALDWEQSDEHKPPDKRACESEV